MKGSYRLTEQAKKDLRRIYKYGLISFSESQADKYYQSLIRQFEKIANNPDLYQSVNEIKKGYRRCVCGSDCIYYRTENGTVEIMAILGQQDLEKWL